MPLIFLLLPFFFLVFLIFGNKKTFSYTNIILISIDHLQAKHLKKYGYPLNTTPNLDNFFDESYLFMNAIAPSSWTLPSAISIFTSIYPDEHGMTRVLNTFSEKDIWEGDDINILSPKIITLTEILKNNYYNTAAFASKNWGFRAESGMRRGFDTYFETDANKKNSSLQPAIEESIEWIKKNKNKKFFLYIQGFDLHDKVNPTKGYDYRYVKQPYTGKYTGDKEEYLALKFSQEKIEMLQEDVNFWRATYDEKINNTDKLMGKFFEKIEKMGVVKNTLIILTSAHGIEYYEHGKFNHGHTLYNELIHIPLAIRIPGQKAGKKINDVVSTIDVVPTILNLAKIKNPIQNQIKGIDLTPSFYGKTIARDIYSETHTFRPTDKWPEDKWSIVTPDKLKFIYSLVSTENGQMINRELFDLKKDPDELKNVISEQQRLGYELEQKLYQHSKKKLMSEFSK